MHADNLVFQDLVAISKGYAVIRGIPGRIGVHAHWTHQIAITMNEERVDCTCNANELVGQGVFVPARHTHAVQPGMQINLFFDEQAGWVQDILGPATGFECASVLDTEAVHAINTCFHRGMDLATGLAIFEDTFQIADKTSPEVADRWKAVMQKAQGIIADATAKGDIPDSTEALIQSPVFKELGNLFSPMGMTAY